MMPPGSCGSTTLMRAWTWMCYQLVPNTGDPASGHGPPRTSASRTPPQLRCACALPGADAPADNKGLGFQLFSVWVFPAVFVQVRAAGPLAAALLAAALAPLVLAPPQPRRAAAPPDADAPAGGLEGAAARCARAPLRHLSVGVQVGCRRRPRFCRMRRPPSLGSTEPLPAAGASASWLDLCDPIF